MFISDVSLLHSAVKTVQNSVKRENIQQIERPNLSQRTHLLKWVLFRLNFFCFHSWKASSDSGSRQSQSMRSSD